MIARFISRLFTRRVHCANCPRFRVIDRRAALDGSIGVIGACANDPVLMANFPELRAAFPVKYPQDWCQSHPCFRAVKNDAGLVYAPDTEHGTEAGFSRAPSFAEAVALAAERQRIESAPPIGLASENERADNRAVNQPSEETRHGST